MTLKPGTEAPAFSLPASGGAAVSLEEFRGKKIVLFLYPKDDTSSCTLEAKDFSDLAKDFSDADAVVIGMSPDSIKKHAKFIAKHDLGVILAADESKQTLQAYGVWAEKSMYGRKYMGVLRTTCLIDRSGRIARVWENVKVAGHASEVLAAAREIP